jgi:hypothetical protein
MLFSFAVSFVPLTYLHVGQFQFGDQVKTIFLLIILLTVLRVPMPSLLFGDLEFTGRSSQV